MTRPTIQEINDNMRTEETKKKLKNKEWVNGKDLYPLAWDITMLLLIICIWYSLRNGFLHEIWELVKTYMES